LQRGFTHGFLISFESKAALDAYGPHPAHEAIKEEGKAIIESVFAFDFAVDDLPPADVPGRVQHMVFFKFNPETSAEKIAEIERAFSELPTKIPGLLRYQAGSELNGGPRSHGMTQGFVLTFLHEDARDAYLPHPAHKEFGGLVGSHLDGVIVVDFTVRPSGRVAAGNGPLRVANGESVRSIYYFPHWWDPWRSDENVIKKDLKYLRSIGINTLLLDHEWSQAQIGDWGTLDRAYRLAKAAGLQIVPWLSLKVWNDLNHGERAATIKKQYGVELKLSCDQDGNPSSIVVYDEATIIAGSEYTLEYLGRYLESGVLAHYLWEGEPRPTVALSVELAWNAGGFDTRTTGRFRRSLVKQYSGDIAALNKDWGTRYALFDDVEPRDKSIFNYADHDTSKIAHPKAVEAHIEFRSQMIHAGLQAMKERVLEKHPNVVFSTEYPYQIASEHPHGETFRIDFGSNPSASLHAEVLYLRMTGLLSDRERDALRRHQNATGQKIVLCYRTYSDWAKPEVEDASIYAQEASEVAHGIGFYSWNEMVDVHLVAPGPGSPRNGFTVEGDVARRMQEHAASILKAYRSVSGGK
jgi:hypothetical protein